MLNNRHLNLQDLPIYQINRDSKIKENYQKQKPKINHLLLIEKFQPEQPQMVEDMVILT
jgi:hypothetical protein